MEKQAPKRYRLSVPSEDTQIHEWMEAQQNVSFSIRMLIKESISKYGIADVTCVPAKLRQGRPTEEESQVRQRTGGTEQVAPVQEPAPSVPTDSEGFIDPDNFFNTNK